MATGAHPDRAARPPALAATPLAEVIRRFGLRADRRLGQHFLLDERLLRRIAAAAGDLTGCDVLEVGPGPGGLTRALLAAGARRVVAIERDRRCIEALGELVAASAGRLELVEADALQLRLADLSATPLTVVANLPYNIATPLLIRWLDELDRVAGLTLMFQREVAQRLAAAPGSRTYGRLSVLVQWSCQVRVLTNLPAGAFVPPPKVVSSLVRLIPRAQPLAADKRTLERVTAAAFGQRRKMLRTSLKALSADSDALLAEAGLPADARAEQIDVRGFCRLAEQHRRREAARVSDRAAG